MPTIKGWCLRTDVPLDNMKGEGEYFPSPFFIYGVYGVYGVDGVYGVYGVDGVGGVGGVCGVDGVDGGCGEPPFTP